MSDFWAQVEVLARHHDHRSFQSGNDELGRYLRERAMQDMRRKVAAPFVLVQHPGARSIIGYYALTATGVSVFDLPPEMVRKLPKYPVIPATLLGRLAVDRRYRGKGFGEFLLMDALHRCWRHSKEVAAFAVVVDAIDSVAKRFYRQYGFLEFPDQPLRLFLPLATIERLFA